MSLYNTHATHANKIPFKINIEGNFNSLLTTLSVVDIFAFVSVVAIWDLVSFLWRFEVTVESLL